MNLEEATSLVFFVKELAPHQAFGREPGLAWHALLDDVDYVKAHFVVVEILKKQSTVEPYEIRREVALADFLKEDN